MKRYTVIGAKRSGVAAARLLRVLGAHVLITDAGVIDAATRRSLEELGTDIEADGHTDAALNCDMVVVSPGVPTMAPLVQKALGLGIPVISEIELASRYCSAPMVAITGSNGKTTTTSMAGHVIGASGRRTFVAGNIGAPFSDIALDAQPDDVVVLEVSSFQLDHIHDFKPRVSVILNITPDHLDRYGGDFQSYAASKCRVFENQRDDDVLITNEDDAVLAGLTAEAHRLRTHCTISLEHEVAEGGCVIRDEQNRDELLVRYQNEEMRMPTEEIPLRGRHNLYNSLAAAVAARVMEVRSDVIRESMASFQGVPHRLEFVRELDGVRYYNDSKATNVNAVWYALESFNESVVLIAGGRDKGNDYGPLKNLVRRKVRVLIALGEGAQKIEDELGPEARQLVRVDTFEDAVQTARMLAEEGEVVVLSPACASFDMFDNYEHRGNTFRQIVASLR